jgi:phasin family protein
MQNQFFDLYRHGVKTAAEVAKKSLESTVRLQEKQLGIVRNILEENQSSADRLAGASSLQDLVSLQTQLAGTQWQRATEFWSSFWQTAAENQKTWFEEVQTQMGQAGDRMREAGFTAARTSEDVARAAANQVSRAAGSIRESSSNAHRKSA